LFLFTACTQDTTVPNLNRGGSGGKAGADGKNKPATGGSGGKSANTGGSTESGGSSTAGTAGASETGGKGGNGGISGAAGNAGNAGAGGSSGEAGMGGASGGVGGVDGEAGAGGILLTDVLAGYAFDKPGVDIEDFSGNNHTAHTRPVSYIAGKLNNAVDFEPGTGYVRLPYEVASTLTDYSVSVWVKPRTTANWARVFDFGNGTDKYLMLTVAAGGTARPRFSIKNAGPEQIVDSKVALSLDVWQHVVVTQAGNTVSLYVNGALAGTNTNVTLNPTMFSTAQSWLGKSQYEDPLYDGAFDEFTLYDRALTTTEVTDMSTGGVPPTTGLVLGYHFDETSGTDLADFSGANKNAAAVTGASPVAGKKADAISLDGSVGYVSLPENVLRTVTDFTVATWVKIDKARNWQRIFDFGNDTDNYMMLAAASTGSSMRFSQRVAGGTEQIVDGAVIPQGTWTHVAVTRKGSTVTLYMDGSPVGSGSVVGYLPADNATKNNWLGKSQYPDFPLQGALDDFRIYARALRAAEVEALTQE
jgi:hypothetical protein